MQNAPSPNIAAIWAYNALQMITHSRTDREYSRCIMLDALHAASPDRVNFSAR